MNAQVIVLENVDREWWVLLQLRSSRSFMPRQLASIGGQHEPEDGSPERTAARELREESGIVPDRLRPISSSRTCTWYWCRPRTRYPPTTPAEMDDARFLRRRFGKGPRALGAPFGHVWVRAESVGDLDWHVMRGVQSRTEMALRAARREQEEEEQAARERGERAAFEPPQPFSGV